MCSLKKIRENSQGLIMRRIHKSKSLNCIRLSHRIFEEHEMFEDWVFQFCSRIQLMLVLVPWLLQALSKALTEDELVYLRIQFKLLEPNKDGRVSLENFKTVIYCFYLFNLTFQSRIGYHSKVGIISSFCWHGLAIYLKNF